MKIEICAKCLETKCACEFYRARFPKEWAMRDRIGHAPFGVLGEPLRSPLDEQPHEAR